MKKPEVSVITLNWNQHPFTVDCVNSVLKQEGDFEIIVVDNDSTDESVKIFEKEFGKNKRVKIIKAGENLGYAGGNNLGVKDANGEYIVILNNDTTVEKGWLKELLEPMKNDSNIGAVSSLEIRNGKRVDLDLYRNYDLMMNVPFQYGVKVEKENHLEDVELIDTNGVRGCSFIYRKELANPPFDDDYFIYGEDTKLSFLLKIQGHTLKLATKSVVNHFHNVTQKTNKEFRKKAIYLNERNMLLNALTFFDPGTTIKSIPVILVYVILSNIREHSKIFYKIKAYVYLVTHVPLILKKRKEISKIKKIRDKELFKTMMTRRLSPRVSKEYK